MSSNNRQFPTVSRVALAALLLSFASSTFTRAAESPAKKSFDIPAGDAAAALGQFARQSGVELFYSPKEIAGAKTNAVRGELTPREALDRMLAGTDLGIAQGKDNSALAVTRGADPNALRAAAAAPLPRDRPARATGEDPEIHVLSPFTVTGVEDDGYRATNTLAGTRLRTPLRDVGSAISVMTKEFFVDTGATDAETLLPYALNTEVSGVDGNFADGLGGNHNGRAEQDQQRLNPQASQRVRGLAEASLTRNFFLTDIPFDDYNTTRVDINRGANSLLFGVGAPGGIINNTVNQAAVDGRDYGETSVRFGERGSHRETIDYHKVLIDGRLAVRVSGLHDDTRFQQQPAFEIDRRFHGAFEAVLFKNKKSEILGRTMLRGNFEVGKIHGTPPNIVPPTDSFTSFFELPDVSVGNVPGVVLPGFMTGNTPSSQIHPQVGITGWKPKQTFDTRRGLNRGTVPSVAELPLDRNIFITFPNITASAASVGSAANPGIGAMTGTLVGARGRQPTPNGSFNYLISQSFFGSNRNGQTIPNFTAPVIMNSGVWDNENNLITGLTNKREQRFDVKSFALEQPLFGGDAGIELAYDAQTFKQNAALPFSFGETVGDNGSGDIKIDLSEYLGTGEPNPNVGRPVMATSGVPDNLFRSTEREAYRATAFYELNLEKKFGRFAWLGRHIFTGFYNEQSIEQLNRSSRGKWTSDKVGLVAYGHDPLHGYFRDIHTWVYMGPSVLGSSIASPGQVKIDGPMRVDLPKEGDFYKANVWNSQTQAFEVHDLMVDSVLVGGGRRKQELDTKVLSWQGRLFNGHLVGLYGWREDESKTYENIPNVNVLGIPQRLPSGEINPERFVLQDKPGNEVKDNTRTWSIVGHVPDAWLRNYVPFGLSAHYSKSENFQPSATRRSVRGDILAPPNGQTKEYGFSIHLLDDRLTARFNWYDTSSQGASVSLGEAGGAITIPSSTSLNRYLQARDSLGLTIDEAIVDAGGTAGQFASYDEVFDKIIAFLPADIQALRKFRVDENGQIQSEPNPGETATRDFVSTGFELDLVTNLTRNWRLALNVGQQESIQDNTATVLRKVVDEIYANIQASPLANLQDWPGRDENQTFSQRYFGQVVAPLSAITARDGTKALELREWRVNLVSNYRFRESWLKGFAVGGALRYQSQNAVGAPNVLNENGNAVPDIGNPFYGPDQMNGDAWVSYRRALSDKVDWKIQLNVRNAFGDSDPIPVVINPDGNVAVIRNANPTTVFVTNTFSF